jgi:hypothetical protein
MVYRSAARIAGDAARETSPAESDYWIKKMDLRRG